MKAYKCTDKHEGLGIIVFAETRGKARGIAMHCDTLEGCEFIDIEVKREPEADQYWRSSIGNMLDFASHPKIYRDLGWFEEGMGSEICLVCSKYEYGSLPESQIDKKTGLCKECADKE